MNERPLRGPRAPREVVVGALRAGDVLRLVSYPDGIIHVETSLTMPELAEALRRVITTVEGNS